MHHVIKITGGKQRDANEDSLQAVFKWLNNNNTNNKNPPPTNTTTNNNNW